MTNYKIPEKWTCLATNSHEDKVLTDYFRDNYGSVAEYDSLCQGDCWFTNIKNKHGNYYEFRLGENKDIPPDGFTPITFEFFERYILKNEPFTDEKHEDLELETIYKKLFNV